MLFGKPDQMSIRKLIETAMMGSKQFKGLKGNVLYKKFTEALNQDGRFDDDIFRKPMIDALIRGDYAAAQSLSQLSLFNLSWLNVKEGKYGPHVMNEIVKQTGIKGSKEHLLPIMASNLSKAPKVRSIINGLLKDGWLLHVGDATIGNFKFSVFQAATAPMHPKYNQAPETALGTLA